VHDPLTKKAHTSRMRESRLYGSVRGARGNSRRYRISPALLHLLTAALGTKRRTAAMQQLGPYRSEADIQQLAL